MTAPLGQYYTLKRRYARSVNLERDLAVPDALDGYLPTARGLDALARIVAATQAPHAVRAWTITGVYGTGKSAFAHFLACLYAGADDPGRRAAAALLVGVSGDRADAAPDRSGTEVPQAIERRLRDAVGDRGFVRAVVTARREPLRRTVLRALARGAEEFWANRQGRRPAVLAELRALAAADDAVGPVDDPTAADASATPGAASGGPPATRDLADLVCAVADASQTGVLLVIDELGKVLEHAAQSGERDDVFVLQQLAEVRATAGAPPVLVLGILHQAFGEYAHGLRASERGEWDKVQGRFEDLPFDEAPEHMMRLVAGAIAAAPPKPFAAAVRRDAAAWHAHVAGALGHPYVADVLPPSTAVAVYPLHPLTALVLPTLCARYAQNDRSLFSYLTSYEPHALPAFLGEARATASAPPRVGLVELYDYFVDVGGAGLAARPQFQRWAEVHSVVRDAAGLTADEAAVLKTVGTLNLVTATGPLRAGRELVIAAVAARPWDAAERARWQAVLDRLAERRLVTYRQQLDEYRVWEGSDVDVEGTVRRHAESERRPIADLLAAVAPLAPLVAERHSYQTGTLRLFERHYVGDAAALGRVATRAADADGVVACWLGAEVPASVPPAAADGKPLLLVPAAHGPGLAAAAREYAALRAVEQGEPALRTDGVARREVRYRLTHAREVLDGALDHAFGARPGQRFWDGARWRADGGLNAALSDASDRAYADGPRVWNELINRRSLTSQGARARRDLLEALVARPDQERLGLTGYGPEVSMYASLLEDTGIHRREDGRWAVGAPRPGGLSGVWAAVEAFCLAAVAAPASVADLYARLAAPPYGVKDGIIPVLVAAVLIARADEISLYRDGTYLPVLGAEQFEILVKQPGRFAVKHFVLAGVRGELFRELEAVLSPNGARLPSGVRNATVLSVVRPLSRFVGALPAVTRKSRQLGATAAAVRDALAGATEPDALLFTALPAACGFAPFAPGEEGATVESGTGARVEAQPRAEPSATLSLVPDSAATGEQRHQAFRRELLRALRELQGHYDQILDRCRARIHDAFGVRSDAAHVREDLRVRAQYLVGRVLDRRVRSFVHAAADARADDRAWLEAVVMVVADRPADSWTDEDALAFDLNLTDLARRFANLEALQKEGARAGREGFEARRLTVTAPDGSETHRLVWLGGTERDLVDGFAARLEAELGAVPHEHQRHAIAVALVERVLGTARDETRTVSHRASDARADLADGGPAGRTPPRKTAEGV